jgi:fibronectin type 3 domain-containing protein
VAPYTVAWDTTQAAPGAHTLTAVAWDAVGNSATATRTVTVANPFGQVNLAWNANSETDLAGYRVYFGTTSGTYSNSVNVGNITGYTVTGLAPGNVYYFVVTASDQGGAESLASNQVSAAR